MPRTCIAAIVTLVVATTVAAEPIVIAHRGASGYVPEHTMESKVLAHAMGADFIEQDVVLSSDRVPVVLHDVYLDAVTDVAARFPGRARDDGRHYAIDFTLAELRQLSVRERISPKTGKARYPARFSPAQPMFRLHTLDEELTLIKELNRTLGRSVGVYVEMKKPHWHRQQGRDLTRAVFEVMRAHGYEERPDQAYLQSFEPASLIRLKDEFKSVIPRIQLIADNRWWADRQADYDAMREPSGLTEVARYASGVGVWIHHLVSRKGESAGKVLPLASNAREAGLLVHAYTARADALPAWASSYEALEDKLAKQVKVDGWFTDFPDRGQAKARAER